MKQLPPKMFKRISDAILAFNGLTAEAQDDIEKNFEAGATGDL